MADIASTKKCSRCFEIKSLCEFSKDRSLKSGFVSHCKSCQHEYYRKRYPLEVVQARRKQRKFPYINGKRDYKSESLWQRYGLLKEDLERMKTEQSNRCKICNKSAIRLVIDHNHLTGKVRGLLCDKCNQGVGYIENHLELLEEIDQYINT